jgi:hypothetical protein
MPSTNSKVILTIGDENEEDISNHIVFFKWKSLINEGYVVHARIIDVHYADVQKLQNKVYLKDARNKPLKIKFKISYWVGEEELFTKERIAYITDLDTKNEPGSNTIYFEFIAIDPPTWYLNRGDADGGVYIGSVSDVIKQVVQKYAPGIEIDVSKTIDNKSNRWWPHRQDPKSFIRSLLDWSSSINDGKTNWVVASVDTKIIIKDQSELKSIDVGKYSVNTNQPGMNNVIKWEKIDNNFITNYQTRLSTGGISATSGLYCDSSNSQTKDNVIVDDDNTSNKQNVNLTKEQGFSKPTNKDIGWTFIKSIPEDSGGLVGVTYQDYIAGRARNIFVGMLDLLSRLKLTVYGSDGVKENGKGAHLLDDPSTLGVSTVSLNWFDYQGNPWIANQKWMVYGFEHIYTTDKIWLTNIFCNRKDADSQSKKIT